jgi:DNA (cytosine-5)-methyltransferase 1
MRQGNLVLSLFPGIGLLDMAFEEAGFCVVRGPDLLWGGDIKRFHPPAGRFDGVIGGPPCQAFSRLRHIIVHRWGEGKVAANLIPEYERCILEAQPQWALMENVPDAPEPQLPDYSVYSFLFNNRWVGGEQERKRRFSFAVRGGQPTDLRRWVEYEMFNPDWAPAVLASGAPVDGGNRKPAYRKGRDNLHCMSRASHRSVADAIRLQGLPDDFLSKAPFTVEGKQRMLGNGVPLPMGRAIAEAIKEALEQMAEPADNSPTHS